MMVLSEKHNHKYNANLPLEFARNLNLESIVEYANKNKFKYAFLIEIYYHSIMMHLDPQRIDHLLKIRKLYEKHFNKFSMSEKRTIMHWIVNYCLENAQIDYVKFKRIIFELNEFRLAEGLVFYPENQIPRVIYIQILLAALAVNEFEWASDFINKYTAKLLPEMRNSLRCMANAFLSFYSKDYREVLKNLYKVEFVDIQDKLFARTLTARAYYELHELEVLLHYIDSSQHFLKNNSSVPETSMVFTLNFFKYLKKIILINEKKGKVQIFSLRNEIEKIEEIGNKKWLLEKIDEFEKNISNTG